MDAFGGHLIERRRYERRAVQFEATLSFAGDSTLHAGVCRDLSEGGVFLATPARADTGTAGRLMTSMPGSSELITFPVSVRWHGRDGMGLEFGALGDHETKAVERAIRRAVYLQSLRPPRRSSPAWLKAVGLLAALAGSAAIGFFVSRYAVRLRQTPAAPGARADQARATASLERPSSPRPIPFALPSAPAASAVAPAASVAAPVTIPAPDGRDPSACIAAYFAEGAFRSDDRLDFICTEADPRKAATQMRVKIVLGSSGKLTPAVNEWSRLGWYELAVLAITRRACCAGVAPLQLPESPAGCASMTATLTALGDAMAIRKEVDAGIKAFETAADCLQMSGKGGYRYTSGPFSGSQVAFASFVKRNEH